jgi:hypothetical protein
MERLMSMMTKMSPSINTGRNRRDSDSKYSRLHLENGCG